MSPLLLGLRKVLSCRFLVPPPAPTPRRADGRPRCLQGTGFFPAGVLRCLGLEHSPGTRAVQGRQHQNQMPARCGPVRAGPGSDCSLDGGGAQSSETAGRAGVGMRIQGLPASSLVTREHNQGVGGGADAILSPELLSPRLRCPEEVLLVEAGFRCTLQLLPPGGRPCARPCAGGGDATVTGQGLGLSEGRPSREDGERGNEHASNVPWRGGAAGRTCSVTW